MDDDLIPLKRITGRLGISRATLWRVSRSAGFPAPVKVLGRVYWRARDLLEMEAALDRFQGRSAFERERRHAKARQAATTAMAAAAKKPKRVRSPVSALAQPDLFGAAATLAPGDAERLK
jgi:predicted DNA-binding transcriptional regulator AlpA